MANSTKRDDPLKGAIAQYVEREEARESFAQEALASRTAFQETGRHLTGADVLSWLKSWGAQAEAEMPECHT